MQTASTNSSSPIYSTPPAYRFAVNSMNSTWQIGFNAIMSLTSGYSTSWNSYALKFGVLEYFSNDDGCVNAACTNGSGVNDVATNFDDGMSKANAQMPTPGNGSNAVGDKPQEVLFFVTDGVEDESIGGARLLQALNTGVKIAILNTEYLPVPVNGFYVQNVEPFIPKVGPALQACASPGLYAVAAIGSDLGQALSSLFQAVVRGAHLTQ